MLVKCNIFNLQEQQILTPGYLQKNKYILSDSRILGLMIVNLNSVHNKTLRSQFYFLNIAIVVSNNIKNKMER